MRVFFDIDGTLLDDQAATTRAASAFYKMFSAKLPFAEVTFYSVWQESFRRQFDRFTSGEISFQEQRRYRMRELFASENLSDSEADARFNIYLRHYESQWLLLSDVVRCLESLSSMPLGIISNGSTAQQHQKLRQTRILDRFRTVVISEELGIAKPAPEIFQTACVRAGIDPSEAVYVGDQLSDDALASRSAGLRGIWLRRASSSNSQPAGITVISTLDYLVDAMGG